MNLFQTSSQLASFPIPNSSLQVDPVRVLKTCLTKCGEVLEQSAGVFGGVQESSLLQEICEVEEGRNKLRGRLVRTRGYGLTCITLDMLHECYVQACLVTHFWHYPIPSAW